MTYNVFSWTLNLTQSINLSRRSQRFKMWRSRPIGQILAVSLTHLFGVNPELRIAKHSLARNHETLLYGMVQSIFRYLELFMHDS